VFWSACLQEGENTLPFDRRFHSLCAEMKLRSVWHRATRCMAQSYALRRSLEELLVKMCTGVKECYLLFSLEPELFILHLLLILMSDVYVCRVAIRHDGESHYLHYRTFWLNLFHMQKKNSIIYFGSTGTFLSQIQTLKKSVVIYLKTLFFSMCY
jgi:hypothetical protein